MADTRIVRYLALNEVEDDLLKSVLSGAVSLDIMPPEQYRTLNMLRLKFDLPPFEDLVGSFKDRFCGCFKGAGR